MVDEDVQFFGVVYTANSEVVDAALGNVIEEIVAEGRKEGGGPRGNIILRLKRIRSIGINIPKTRMSLPY